MDIKIDRHFFYMSSAVEIRRHLKVPGDGHRLICQVQRVSGMIILWAIQDGQCFYCKGPITRTGYHKTRNASGFTRDHVVPRSAGGTRNGNLVLACHACNNKKSNVLPTSPQIVKAQAIWDEYEKMMEKR